MSDPALLMSFFFSRPPRASSTFATYHSARLATPDWNGSPWSRTALLLADLLRLQLASFASALVVFGGSRAPGACSAKRSTHPPAPMPGALRSAPNTKPPVEDHPDLSTMPAARQLPYVQLIILQNGYLCCAPPHMQGGALSAAGQRRFEL